jgi:hypothetical protein
MFWDRVFLFVWNDKSLLYVFYYRVRVNGVIGVVVDFVQSS